MELDSESTTEGSTDSVEETVLAGEDESLVIKEEMDSSGGAFESGPRPHRPNAYGPATLNEESFESEPARVPEAIEGQTVYLKEEDPSVYFDGSGRQDQRYASVNSKLLYNSESFFSLEPTGRYVSKSMLSGFVPVLFLCSTRSPDDNAISRHQLGFLYEATREDQTSTNPGRVEEITEDVVILKESPKNW